MGGENWDNGEDEALDRDFTRQATREYLIERNIDPRILDL